MFVHLQLFGDSFKEPMSKQSGPNLSIFLLSAAINSIVSRSGKTASVSYSFPSQRVTIGLRVSVSERRTMRTCIIWDKVVLQHCDPPFQYLLQKQEKKTFK